MTPATEEKRNQLQLYIDQVLAKETAVKGVVGIGSIATGHCHANSDIDIILFLDPFNLYISPAEAYWRPSDDTYHSIFDESLTKQNAVPLDIARLDWKQWKNPEFEWPEGRKAELAAGWIAYDPAGETAQLIADHTTYPEDTRLKRLDEAIVWLDQHLAENKPETIWQDLSPAIAHDRLESAYDYMTQLLFAYNRRWRIWRNRELQVMLQLSWLPVDFADRVLLAANAPSLDYDGYMNRVTVLRALFKEILDQLIHNGDYSYAPIDQAFLRLHEEPGRSWNMDDWYKFYQARQL